MFIHKNPIIGKIDFIRALELAKKDSYRYIILNTDLRVTHLSNVTEIHNCIQKEYFVYDTLTSELKLKIS